MQMSRRYRWVLILLLLACPRQALAIPSDELLNSLEPTGHVNDYAGVLKRSERQALESRCRELQEQTGAQLAIVTLQSLRGGEIEDFTNKLFARWHVGEKGKDNGLMLLVAMDERKSKIEVGYGLEPIIPDVLAGRILDHQLRPEFRQQQYAAGLTAAVDKISELVKKGEPADRAALARSEEPSLGQRLLLVLFLAIFVAVGGLLIGLGLGARQFGAIFPGAMFAGIPMLMGLAAAGLLGPAIHFPVALLVATFGYNQAKNQKPPGGRGYRRSSSGPAVWTWGDSTGSSGGWNSGGGGFSQGWGGVRRRVLRRRRRFE